MFGRNTEEARESLMSLSGLSSERCKYSLQEVVTKKREIKQQEEGWVNLFLSLAGLRMYAQYSFLLLFWIVILDSKVKIGFGVVTLSLYFISQLLGVKIFSVKSASTLSTRLKI